MVAIVKYIQLQLSDFYFYFKNLFSLDYVIYSCKESIPISYLYVYLWGHFYQYNRPNHTNIFKAKASEQNKTKQHKNPQTKAFKKTSEKMSKVYSDTSWAYQGNCKYFRIAMSHLVSLIYHYSPFLMLQVNIKSD